jgi:MFS family permease
LPRWRLPFWRRGHEPSAAGSTPAGARLGLSALFGSTFFGLVGYFILSPLLLLRLKGQDVSSTLPGLFVATGWLGIFLMTPFASSVANRIGRQACMWLSSGVLLLCALLYTLSHNLPLWFALNLLSGIAMSLHWVLGFNALGLLWTALIPAVPKAADAGTAQVGLRGLVAAVAAHPIIKLAGFVGGFFETGVTSILPLYGLALGLSAAAAAVMVSISGLGGVVLMIPAGLLADRFQDHAQGRRALMVWSAAVMLLATLALPWVANQNWLAWPIVFIWGGAGGTLYMMAMTDIGSREKGITLVNSTAVLVLTYTLGGLLASGLSGALIDWSPAVAFPAVLLLVAAVGLAALWRARGKVL